jgi:hypothetical protein
MPIVQHTLYKCFDFATGRLVAEQSGWDNLSIVENQEIAGLQQRRQIREAAIGKRAIGCMQTQQTARTALLKRVLSDQLGGQGVAKVPCAHRAQW